MDFATNLMRSMQDGFSVLNLDGVAVDANPAFCQMTGFSRDELDRPSLPRILTGRRRTTRASRKRWMRP